MVSNADAQRAAASSLPDDAYDDRHREARHLAQIARDRLCLAPFLGPDARVGSGRIHKGDDGPGELLCQLHDAQRLAISLGLRIAEVPILALFQIPSFLLPDDHHGVTVIRGHSRNDGGIVAEASVAVNLRKVLKHPLDIIQSVWTLLVPGQESPLPGMV